MADKSAGKNFISVTNMRQTVKNSVKRHQMVKMNAKSFEESKLFLNFAVENFIGTRKRTL